MNYWGIYDNHFNLVFDKSGQAIILRDEYLAKHALQYLKKYQPEKAKYYKAIRIPFIENSSILNPENILK